MECKWTHAPAQGPTNPALHTREYLTLRANWLTQAVAL